MSQAATLNPADRTRARRESFLIHLQTFQGFQGFQRLGSVGSDRGAILRRMPSAVTGSTTNGPSPLRIESTPRFTVGAAAVVLTAAWLLIYGPTIAGGFIKDDFAWVYHGRTERLVVGLSGVRQSRRLLSPAGPTDVQRDRGVVWHQPGSLRTDKSSPGTGLPPPLCAGARPGSRGVGRAGRHRRVGVQLSRHQHGPAVVQRTNVAAGHSVLDARGARVDAQPRRRPPACSR